MNGTGYTEQRLPDARRPRRHRRREVGRRLAQRPREGLRRCNAPTDRDDARPDREVVADWHNGSSAMIGKSYDGTLANGVAATGVEGLKTIVPGLGDFRLVQLLAHRRRPPQHELPGGASTGNDHTVGGHEPAGVDLPGPLARPAQPVNERPQQRRQLRQRRRRRARRHQQVLERPRLQQGREQGQGRGLRDPRLPGRQRPHGPHGLWWEALKANNVPRKLWLLRAGHEDPFESRRAEVGHHPAPLVRPLPLRRQQRHRERAEGHGRGRDGRLGQLRRVAHPRHAERRPLPARRSTDPAARARSPASPAAASPTR